MKWSIAMLWADQGDQPTLRRAQIAGMNMSAIDLPLFCSVSQILAECTAVGESREEADMSFTLKITQSPDDRIGHRVIE